MPVVKRKRMFRGATRGNVFQTVDLGAGTGSYIERQAERFPKRKYAAVDYALDYSGFFGSNRVRLQKKGVQVGGDIREFLEMMAAKGIRTRHLNMDMPYPVDSSIYSSSSIEAFKHVIRLLPRVLLPNGKLYVTSEDHLTIEHLQRLAMQDGFAVRQRKAISPLTTEKNPLTRRLILEKYPNYYRTSTMRGFANVPLYRLEITYNLKKAFPKKEVRRRLSRVQKKATSKE